MTFGESLKKVLDEMGVSQRKFASMVGKEATYISKIINEKINVSWDTINQFAEALGINPGQFFANNEEMVYFMLQELPEETKEFIRGRESKPWLFLAKDLKNSDLTPDDIRKVVELWKNMLEKGAK